MPASPWQTLRPLVPSQEYLAFASFLPLARVSKLPLFLKLSGEVRRQLGVTAGVMGYSLRVHFLARRFWTLSVWESTEALDTFVATRPHAEVMKAIRPVMGQPVLTSWTAKGAALPPSWDDALARLKTASRGPMLL